MRMAGGFTMLFVDISFSSFELLFSNYIPRLQQIHCHRPILELKTLLILLNLRYNWLYPTNKIPRRQILVKDAFLMPPHVLNISTAPCTESTVRPNASCHLTGRPQSSCLGNICTPTDGHFRPFCSGIWIIQFARLSCQMEGSSF